MGRGVWRESHGSVVLQVRAGEVPAKRDRPRPPAPEGTGPECAFGGDGLPEGEFGLPEGEFGSVCWLDDFWLVEVPREACCVTDVGEAI
jgi:hypothetical protein